jgi:hypothetical protein
MTHLSIFLCANRLIGDIRTTRTSGDRNKNTTRLVCLAQEVATPSPS